MIYIVAGSDTKKKNSYLKKLYKDNPPIYVPEKEFTKEILLSHLGSVNLFGEYPIVVFENVLKNLELSSREILELRESKTKFVFIEEKILAADKKKWEKNAEIVLYEDVVKKEVPKFNVFAIADSFSKRDKVGTWILYREAVLYGIPTEEISGILFWKIKTMILNGTKMFSEEELKNQSSSLVSLYHDSHLGNIDFVFGLEQFILKSLSK